MHTEYLKKHNSIELLLDVTISPSIGKMLRFGGLNSFKRYKVRGWREERACALIHGERISALETGYLMGYNMRRLLC